jgi:dihydroxyacid dehydratase/phosphogluconate dehydratase
MTNKEILARAKTINYPCIYVPAGEIRPGRAEWRKQLRSISSAQRDTLLTKIARQQARMQREQDQAKFQAQQSA